jgi:hypothetical protein
MSLNKKMNKANLKKQLNTIGVKVEGNFVRKKDIQKVLNASEQTVLANTVSDLMKEIPHKNYATLNTVKQQYEMLCHTLGTIRHYLDGEDSESAKWVKSTIDDLVKRLS